MKEVKLATLETIGKGFGHTSELISIKFKGTMARPDKGKWTISFNMSTNTW